MEARIARVALTLALAASLPAIAATSEPWDGKAAPRSAAMFQQAMLGVQNQARAGLGEAPMAWDAGLAADAQGYADELARTGTFEHADQPDDETAQGENLWMGTKGAYTYARMAGMWVDEKRFFVNRPTPDFSTSGNWEDVGHYTQIVWRATNKVGCGIASNDGDDVVVCRYAQPGNVDGERAL